MPTSDFHPHAHRTTACKSAPVLQFLSKLWEQPGVRAAVIAAVGEIECAVPLVDEETGERVVSGSPPITQEEADEVLAVLNGVLAVEADEQVRGQAIRVMDAINAAAAACMRGTARGGQAHGR